MKVPAEEMPHAQDYSIKESDIYTEEGLENYADDDIINPLEEGFMIGYLST